MARLVLTDASPLIGLARIDGRARLDVRDPDAQCAGGCRLEVFGGNATDDKQGYDFKSLDTQPTPADDPLVWVAELNPETKLKVDPGEDLHLEVLLTGPGFSMH